MDDILSKVVEKERAMRTKLKKIKEKVKKGKNNTKNAQIMDSMMESVQKKEKQPLMELSLQKGEGESSSIGNGKGREKEDEISVIVTKAVLEDAWESDREAKLF